MLRRFLLCALAALALTGCATGPRQVFHSFNFDGWKDGWYSGPNSNVQLQEYSQTDAGAFKRFVEKGIFSHTLSTSTIHFAANHPTYSQTV